MTGFDEQTIKFRTIGIVLLLLSSSSILIGSLIPADKIDTILDANGQDTILSFTNWNQTDDLVFMHHSVGNYW